MLMIYVKVKTKDVRFSIPVPYALLNIAISVAFSKFIQKHAIKWTKEHFKRKGLNFTFPIIDKSMLKPIVKELRKHKGMVLVDVKATDGTEVRVKL
ncbi:Uncharacterised protein [Priestia megaterium]|nr:Uncharacterised protein [Priestia megaterium]